MKKIPESKIKDEVKKILKLYGVKYFMPAASMYGKRGTGDFVCCVNGYYLEIETKASDKGESGLTPLQAKNREDILKNNGSWLLVYDDSTLRSLKTFIQIHLEDDEIKITQYRNEKTF